MLVLVILWIGLIPAIISYEDAVWIKDLNDLIQKDPKITVNKVMSWWSNIENRRDEGHSRVFPICLAKNPSTNVWDEPLSKMKAFPRVIDNINKKNATVFKTSKHLWGREGDFNLKKISVYKITYGMNKQRYKNWVRLEFEFSQKMHGIYLQTIVGPLGVPKGEFTKEFSCQDHTIRDAELVVPCTFSPRSEYKRPNVYILELVKRPKDTFSVHYKWADASCDEVPYLQFLVIALEALSGLLYKVFLTPVYRHGEMDTLTGLATTYYQDPAFEKECQAGRMSAYNLNPETSNRWKETKGVRVIPNKDYDKCVTKGEGRDDKDVLWGKTCPPGPFTCKSFSEKEWQQNWEGYWERLVRNRDNFRHCCELNREKLKDAVTTTTLAPESSTPSTTNATQSTSEVTSRTTKVTPGMIEIPSIPQTTPPTSVTEEDRYGLIFSTTEAYHRNVSKYQEEAFLERAKAAQRRNQITHGDLSVLVWLVFIPIVDHIARFYKEFPDIPYIGLGSWIFVHILIHSIGLILIWLSFGLVVGGAETLGNVSFQHFSLGVAALIFQHVQFVSGAWFQDVDDKRKTFVAVLAHSVVGYLSYITSVAAVLLSNATFQKRLLASGLLLVRLVAFGVSTFVELRQDQILGVVPHRPQFPVLCRIVLDKGVKSPLVFAKLIVLGVTSIILLAFFIVYKTSAEAIPATKGSPVILDLLE